MSPSLGHPFAGIRVVALEQAVAMPYCTFVMAEMGAEVIKIERPESGDVVRGWDDAVRGLSTGFVWVNAGKKSVELDLTSAVGKEALLALVEDADVFVENLGPGAAQRLGVGPEILDRLPTLVYVSISGFGQDGPYASTKAYDLTMQGETGILLSNGYPGMPAKVGLPITDLIAGSNAALGIAMALYRRQASGAGCFMDLSMFDSALPWLGYFPHHAWHGGTEPPLSGMRHQFIVPYGPYLASDGRYVSLVVADDRQWQLLCTAVIDRPHWIDDPIMGTIASRRLHRALAEPAFESVMAAKSSDFWLERLSAAGIPFGRVNRMAEVLEHPQALAREMFVTAHSPVGELPLVRFPLAPVRAERRLPALGEHTAEVLEALRTGRSDREVSV